MTETIGQRIEDCVKYFIEKNGSAPQYIYMSSDIVKEIYEGDSFARHGLTFKNTIMFSIQTLSCRVPVKQIYDKKITNFISCHKEDYESIIDKEIEKVLRGR